MPTLSPNEIAFCIYWCGSQFGPNLAAPVTEGASGNPVQHIPAPGSPERTKIENWLDVAIAVCLAESGGNTEARNGSSSATGLWQIMVSVHGDKIKFAETYWASERSKGKRPGITDPLVNTQVAALIYQESGWKPWEAYNNGSYKKHLGHGKAAYRFLTSKKNLKMERDKFLANMMNNDTFVMEANLLPGANLINALDKVPWLSPILSFLKSAGMVAGVFILGCILLLIGLWAIISKSKPGKTIKSATKAVTKL